MTYQSIFENVESILPILIGAAFSLFAIYGARELLKEAKVALKKS